MSTTPLLDAPVQTRPLRPAASLVVLRDAPGGIEVLLLRRAERGDHQSGAWVFPGGIVDPADRAVHGLCDGPNDAAASARLGLHGGALDYPVAAVRGCFEEAGLLFARSGDGAGSALITLRGEPGAALAAQRGPLHRGEMTLGALCAAHGLRLATDRLAYFSRWLTPPGRAKRLDTRFFVAVAPAGQPVRVDGREVVEHLWLRAADALARAWSEHDGRPRAGAAETALRMLGPTRATLAAIARFGRAAEVLAWVAAQPEVPLIAPRMGIGANGPRSVHPDEGAWAEIGRLDPQGAGHVRCEIRPGEPVRLSERVIRVTAGNGGVMTGPGTNSYLLRAGADDAGGWAVIDPGPLDETHVDALLAAAPGPIRWIFATHTHRDHSPAAAPLRAKTGARVFGRRPACPQGQDASFAPDHDLQGGEAVALGSIALHAVHTPGHASNHLCFHLADEKTLFTGDHVMQASTVVINPPDGDMAAYLHSLRDLLALDLAWLAPGHGFLMAQPKRALEALIAHRVRREAKVLGALHALGPTSAATLLARVYDDVPGHLHGAAMRSLQAHLFKLRDEGSAREAAGQWSS